MTQPTLLILDDDPALPETLGRALRWSYRVLLAVEKLQIDRENRILRTLVGAHPELSRVFEQQLDRLWGAPAAAPAARFATH